MFCEILLNNDIHLCITGEAACIIIDIDTKDQINTPLIKGTTLISLSEPLQKSSELLGHLTKHSCLTQ